MAVTNLGKVSILLKGDFLLTATYDRLDLVNYEGSSYLCRERCTGIEPEAGTTTQYWQPFGATVVVANVNTTGIVRPDGTTLAVKDSATGRIGIHQDVLDNIDAIVESIGDTPMPVEDGTLTDNISALDASKMGGKLIARNTAEFNTIVNAKSWTEIAPLLKTGDTLILSLTGGNAQAMNNNGIVGFRIGGVMEIMMPLDNFILVRHYTGLHMYTSNQFSIANAPVWYDYQATQL